MKQGQKYNPYGILGFTRGKVSDNSGSAINSDLSYGFGININVIRQAIINIEWLNYYDKEVDINAINLGATWRF